MRRTFTAAVLVLASVLPAGCNNAKSDRGFVQREWSLTLRELGIVPVFPPREDVVVGDVYASSFNPDDLDAQELMERKWKDLGRDDRAKRLQIGMSSRLARIDTQRATLDEYSATLSAPATNPDYRDIVGNPALAAANESVAKAERDLQAANSLTKQPAQDAKNATDALRQATREREDAAAKVTRADNALKESRGKPADPAKIKQLEVDLATRKQTARDRDNELLDWQRKLADTPAEPVDKKKEAERKVVEATRLKEDADRAIRFAEADLAAEKARLQDPAELEKQLQDAKDELAKKTDAETTATRVDADAKASLKAADEAAKPLIADAQQKLDAIKAVRDNIEKAGAKLLYSQPRDAVRNVYDARSPLSGTGGADDLLNSRVNRLRLVGFPEFATASFTSGDLAALIPIEAFSLGLNISSTQVERVSVKVPAAESYGLSLNRLMASIAEQRTKPDPACPKSRRMITQWLLKDDILGPARFKFGESHPGGKVQKVYFRVIAEVFYARALDVSVFASSSFGVRAQLAAPIPTKPVEEGDPKQGSLESFKQPTMDASGLGSPAGAAALADMRARLGTTMTVPGGQMQLVSYNEKSIGLRRIWDRPVAIGFRGLTLEVDIDTGVISKVFDSTTATPQIVPGPLE